MNHSTRGRNLCECGKKYSYFLKKCPACGMDEAFGGVEKWNPNDWVYDLETYPNCFLAGFLNVSTQQYFKFEISTRVNHIAQMWDFIEWMGKHGQRGVGFNNIGFDYPILHLLRFDNTATAADFYELCQQIISGNRLRVWYRDWVFDQLDLMLVHHFDNKNKRTSLKWLQVNMRSESIEDLPIKPGTMLTFEQMESLSKYHDHDMTETLKFYYESIDEIEFREQLGKKFVNANEAKVGSMILIDRMEKKTPGICYMKQPNGQRVPRQTFYSSIDLEPLIFPYIQFNSREFNSILEFFKSKTIYETNGVFTDSSTEFGGIEFVFGMGGIHASVKRQSFFTTDTHTIIDVDVKSFYPSLAIKNKKYPKHLGEVWYTTQDEMLAERNTHKKGTVPNRLLKIALNGSFGKTNDLYSPFLDPAYMLTITINGQLLLCMLIEYLAAIPGIQLIQANTDGITALCPNAQRTQFKAVCDWWQAFTMLTLEEVEYKRMFIRDVNNYIAETKRGDAKRKGAYAYKNVEWHKNHSELIAPYVAGEVLLNGADALMTLVQHENKFDFCAAVKCPSGSKIYADDQLQQKVTRYYVSTSGVRLFKKSPPADGFVAGQWKRKNGINNQQYYQIYNSLPLVGPEIGDVNCKPWDERINTKNRGKFKIRVDECVAGRKVTICNHMRDFDFRKIDYEYYLNEIDKLTKGMIQ